MRNKSASLLFLLAISPVIAQNSLTTHSNGDEGSCFIEKNNAEHPCLTPEQYDLIEKQCAENVRLLKLGAIQKSVMNTSFSWPLKTVTGFNDCSYYTITAYVDQNATSGAIEDYNCGANTYDGHKGTDIAAWPLPFYKMDNDQLEVIAAAPGTIVAKVDGNFDKNCNVNNLTPNHIIIEHADGSRALYLHMKQNSLTSKTVGQTVVAGEFLGRVGSSGSSSGPHLHFEVWSGSTIGTLNDPYSGTCNTLNGTSWWASQKPYTEPAVIKASVHPVPAVFPACPGTEIPNEDSCFASGASAKFYIFMRNETNGMTVNMRILNPNSTVFTSWTHASTVNISGSYWYYTKTLPTLPGTYTFEAEYNGIICSRQFNIDCNSLNTETIDLLKGITISPNPSNGLFAINSEEIDNGNYTFTITSITGQTIAKEDTKIENNRLNKQISVSGISNGIYYMTIDNGKAKVVRKLVVQDK
jgi:murein DD-endopeptidase MepM/ murein hydrolase activator NlpD